jgi:DNA-binding beta-propeller fold protein YncE
MPPTTTRRASTGARTVLRAALCAALGALLLLSASLLSAAAAASYEVWALDQGTNRLYVFTPDLEVAEVVDFPEGVDMPHMVSFTSDGGYAFIANVASGNVAVVRAHDREVVALIATGAGTHYAGVVPGDRSVIVDVIGEGKLVELLFDAEREEVTVGRELVIADDPLFVARASEFPSSSPICHAYDREGRYAYVTLGPSLANAGLIVLDIETFTLARVHPGSEIAANCGTALGPDGRRLFLTGGSVDQGLWFAYDTVDGILEHVGDSGGTDAHGLYPTPDGREVWLVNRHSSNGLVIDPVTLEIVDEIPFSGKSPDIMAMSPDGRFVFVTLRGEAPRSGPHAIAGDTPGVAVLDVATRELVTILRPDAGNPASDFHAVAVRPLER